MGAQAAGASAAQGPPTSSLTPAHNLGLCTLPTQHHPVLGYAVSLQVEDADERELVLLRHLHKALGASVRGAAEHRSLQCVCMAAHIGVAVRGRGGELAKEREALWEPLEQRYTPHTGALKKDAEGWADPLLEELPVHLPTDRFVGTSVGWFVLAGALCPPGSVQRHSAAARAGSMSAMDTPVQGTGTSWGVCCWQPVTSWALVM